MSTVEDRNRRAYTRDGGRDGHPSSDAHRTDDDGYADVARARAAVRTAHVTYRQQSRRHGGADTWQDFVGRYGWRAYALPVLVVITVAALLTAARAHSGSTPVARTAAGAPTAGARKPPAAEPAAVAPPTASGDVALKSDVPGPGVSAAVPAAAALPPGAAYTVKGAGTFRTLTGGTAIVGSSGRLWRYEIQVENGITDVDLAQFASDVDTTLADPRSWSGHGVRLQRIDSGTPDFRVTLTSALTVRKLCGYTIHVETSCYVPAGGTSPVNRVVIDDARWMRGAQAYVGDLAAYRQYMINHEDGHALGHEHAHQCLRGGLAPTMMQQTFGLKSASTGAVCQANPWPYPPGVKGAPGAEQQDTAANDEYGLAD